ncbi:hypothetical protein GCK32_020079 [Trichostrongylus colubriformis]|uniref:Uncharacterized protein n=1 Tax=Trichostrongylus colubriformis TaxID=6319 RepID=A0AAN8ISF5_TRICO
METSMADLQEEVAKQDARVTDLSNKIDAFGQDVQKLRDYIRSKNDSKEGDEPLCSPPRSEEAENQEVEEDLLDLDYEDYSNLDEEKQKMDAKKDEVRLDMEQESRGSQSQKQDAKKDEVHLDMEQESRGSQSQKHDAKKDEVHLDMEQENRRLRSQIEDLQRTYTTIDEYPEEFTPSST